MFYKTSREFHKQFFMADTIKDEDQQERINYLQKKFGVLKYPTTKVYQPSDHEDVLFACLGAVRSRYLKEDIADVLFETTAVHILEAGGVIDYKTEKLSVNADFNNSPKALGALTLMALASILKKHGTSFKLSFLTKVKSLFADHKDPMLTMVGHYVVAWSERGTFFGYLHRKRFDALAKLNYNKDSRLTKKMLLFL